MSVLAEKQIRELFDILDTSSTFLQDKLDLSYLDSLIETLDIMSNVDDVEGVEGISDSEFGSFISKIKTVDIDAMNAETVRKAIQMAVLKASRSDKMQANYQITPDTIGNLISYLLSGLYRNADHITILDPAMGSGNLLGTITNDFRSRGVNVDAIGIENDEALAELASLNFELQKSAGSLYHEDTIQDLVVGNVDTVVSDLPIGYYPIDENTVKYKTKANKGHSYVHHLLMEYSMDHLQPGGFGIFLVPSELFKTEEAKVLLAWIQQTVYLQGILNLPTELFASEQAQKSILILQKPGKTAQQVEKVLLGEFPSFNNPAEMKRFLTMIDDWEINNFNKKSGDQ